MAAILLKSVRCSIAPRTPFTLHQLLSSQAKLAMRSKANELQHRIIRFSINQHKVGLHVTVPVILPVAGQRVVAMLLRQRLVIRQSRDDGPKIDRQRLPMLTFGFSLIVALELTGLLNRPHSDPPSDPR